MCFLWEPCSLTHIDAWFLNLTISCWSSSWLTPLILVSGFQTPISSPKAESLRHIIPPLSILLETKHVMIKPWWGDEQRTHTRVSRVASVPPSPFKESRTNPDTNCGDPPPLEVYAVIIADSAFIWQRRGCDGVPASRHTAAFESSPRWSNQVDLKCG